MTQIALSSSSSVLVAAAHIARIAMVTIATQVAAIWAAYRNRRAVSELMGWDDVMLKDIGVTRGDVYRALACPTTDDPSARLVVFGKERQRHDRVVCPDRHHRVTETVQAMLIPYVAISAEETPSCRP